MGVDPATNHLYIIIQGRAELQYTRLHFNNPIRKTMKVINKNGNSEKNKLSISPNLFGFVSMILRRRVSLTALSKEFLVAYELEQKDFDESVSQYPLDFETVCELRDKILSLNIPESYEGSELIDPRLHFVPSRQLVIRKSSKGPTQIRRLRPRREHSPPSSRFDLMHDDLTEEADPTIPDPLQQNSSEKGKLLAKQGGKTSLEMRNSSLLAQSPLFMAQ